MRPRKSSLLVLALVFSQEADVARIEKAFKAARPDNSELSIFMLDWASSLNDAKTRAAKEKRPIFFVSTVQLKEAGSLITGHC